MKRSFCALLTMFAVTLSAVSFSFAETTGAPAASGQINQLAAQLPSSDAVVVVDMQRLMKDALPQFFASKVQVINEVNTKIDEIKSQIGIDLRQFEQLAVGLTFKQSAPNKLDYEPVVLARGKLNSAALLAVAKVAAKGKYREEKAGAKTIYIFSLKEIMQDNKPKISTPKAEEDFKKMLSQVPAEVAATSFDDTTLAIGSLARVRETIGGNQRVSPDILSLVNRKPNSIMSFGGNVPTSLAQVLKLDNDELGKNIKALRQVHGMMDVVGANTLVSIAAKTFNPDQAKDLEDTLAGLQMIGAGFLSGAQGADKQVYARMLEKAKISRAADEVMINLEVSNSDLGVLIGKQ